VTFEFDHIFKRATDQQSIPENYTITGILPMQIVYTGKK